MPLALPRLPDTPVIRFEEFPLEKADIEWLSKELPKKPTMDDVNRLANRLSKEALVDDERRRRLSVLIGLQESLNGNFVVRGDRALGSAGKTKLSELQLLALTGARPVNGELEKMKAVKEGMEPFLIGQQHLRQPFADFYAATQAPGRRIPPVMVLVGPDGHGKAQAVDGYAEVTGGGPVHYVDLVGKSDRDYGALFEGGGPLALDTLKDIAESNGVVWIAGMESLNSPKIAHGIASRITAQKGTRGHVKVPYFLDFNVEPEALEDNERGAITDMLAKALDVQGLRAKASQAVFKRLGPEAMLVYAESMMSQIMRADGLSELHVSFDPDAKKFLGELLATPHRPLNELEARLRELIIRHIDTQTSVYRKGGFIRIALGKPFQDNPQLRDQLIQKFREKHVDLFEGHTAFEPLETGRVVDRVDLADRLIEMARTYAHLLRFFGVSLEVGDPVGVVKEMESAARELSETLAEAAKDLRSGANKRIQKKQGPLTPELYARFDKATQDFATAVTKVAAEPLLVVPEHLKIAIELRQQIYELVDLYSEGGPLKRGQVTMASELASRFSDAFADLAKKVEASKPERRFTNLRVGIEALGAVVDMAGMAASSNVQLRQIDIIKREDAKACRDALEEARAILVPFTIDNVLRYRPLIDAIYMAGYQDKGPLLMKLADIAKDLLDSMQGEEVVNARERSELAVSALREFLSDTVGTYLEGQMEDDHGAES